MRDDICRYHGGRIRLGEHFTCCLDETDFPDPTPAQLTDARRAELRATVAASLHVDLRPNASGQETK